jgi:hypothetical protein
MSYDSWRQGNVISIENFVGIDTPQGYDFAIAMSHSCDIKRDISVEDSIEFALAKIIVKADGSYTHSKNSRKLHLVPEEIKIKSVLPLFNNGTLELVAGKKIAVKKTVIDEKGLRPDSQLSTSLCNIFVYWLSSRYKRCAFPDSLSDRLKNVISYIRDEVKTTASEITGVFIKYEPDEHLEISKSYGVSILIVYRTDNAQLPQDEKAGEIAAALKKEFNKLVDKAIQKLQKTFRNPDGTIPAMEGLILKRCEAVGEDEFTLQELRMYQLLNIDDLSYRTDPTGPVTNF